MASKLEDFNWDVRHSVSTNPLDDFLDGSIWEITDKDRQILGMKLGNYEEYYHTMQNLRTALYNRARQTGKSLRSRKVEDNAIVVQAYQKKGG